MMLKFNNFNVAFVVQLTFISKYFVKNTLNYGYWGCIFWEEKEPA